MPPPDALQLELFRHANAAVVDELDINIQRTAHSPLVYEFKDFCCGILTRDFRLLCHSSASMPIFVADLGRPVEDAVGVIGEARVERGDIFLTNYNAASGSHLNNAVVATPLHHGAEVAGYLTIRSHWVDVGGLVPGSQSYDARSILHEGVQYRGLKVASRGDVVPETVATIQANSWLPELVTGDLMALVAACKLGCERWQEYVADRFGAREVDDLVEAQFAASAAVARAAVEALPDGVYRASCELDDSGADGTPPLRLGLELRVSGSTLVADLSELPPQVEWPINSGASGGATSSIRVAFKSLVAPWEPADHGLFEPLEVVVPPGTVMSAVDRAPMGYWQQLPPTLIDLFLRAIGERVPELVPAGHFGSFSVVTLSGRSDGGTWWRLSNGGRGGFGGHAGADGDGPLPVLMLGDNPALPIELREGRYPVRFHGYRLRRRSGGAGIHRGGPGFEQTIETLVPAFLTTSANRTRDPAWGLAGGEAGQPGEVHIRLPNATRWRRVGRLAQLPVPAGTMIRSRTGGGGGWGRAGG